MNRTNEVLRVTADGQFEWNEDADRMIEEGDFSGQPAMQHILRELLNNRAAVLAEREACAKVCEERVSISRDVLAKSTAGLCAAAIRARGEK